MQKYGIVNTDTLNLRSGPSTTARVLGQLKQGTVLQILSDPGFDWLEVQTDGTTNRGYVSKPYLTLTDVKPGSAPAPAPATPPVATTPPVTTPPVATTPPAQPAPAQPAAPTPSADTASAPAIGKAEVTTDSLNIRSGPGTGYAVLNVAPRGTVLAVLQNQGDWIKVRLGKTEGYSSAQYLNLNTTKPITTSGYLVDQADLLAAKLEPTKLIPNPAPGTLDAAIARTWNNYGGLLTKLAAQLNCPVNGIVATITAESGGNCFGPDGRMIIRFENHIFWSQWGMYHQDQFNSFFDFNRTSPANSWKDHYYRTSPSDPFKGLHGNQSNEWEALTIARALNDDAALSSISMGAGQIMGFHFRRIGYDTPQAMFYQLSRSAAAQLLAMFDFVRGTNASSPAIDALRTGDYLAFANTYNGSGNAPTYRDIITNNVRAFNRLIATAR